MAVSNLNFTSPSFLSSFSSSSSSSSSTLSIHQPLFSSTTNFSSFSPRISHHPHPSSLISIQPCTAFPPVPRSCILCLDVGYYHWPLPLTLSLSNQSGCFLVFHRVLVRLANSLLLTAACRPSATYLLFTDRTIRFTFLSCRTKGGDILHYNSIVIVVRQPGSTRRVDTSRPRRCFCSSFIRYLAMGAATFLSGL